MPALTPQNLVNLETRMSYVSENAYGGLNANTWWPTIVKVRSTTAGKEILAWLLSTARIRSLGKFGGNLPFEDLVSQTMEMEPEFAGDAFKLTRKQFEDTDSKGFNLAAEWSQQIGAQMAYWPQELAAQFLMNGHQIEAYDKRAFFATDHPVNPYLPGKAYANLFTGAPDANTGYPGRLPIHGIGVGKVTVDEALENLQKLIAYVGSRKMPNGVQPRRLRLRYLLVPPALEFRAVQLTQSKFIAQAVAGGGAASADVEALISRLGFASPVVCPELAGFEDDQTYFAVCEEITDGEVGGLIYLDRDPFKINFYGPVDQAQLNRVDELEWHCKGRNALKPGHPYTIYKVKGV